jgi:CRISPR-associated protein Cmr4
MSKRILYIFTRTPLHVGAGTSVGAIDQPIIRERHTGFPVIPASSLKGTFADEWNERVMVARKAPNGQDEQVMSIQRSADGKWLFGETDANKAAAGALQFTEARLLAFPVRSAKGSFAWITCPLILRRAIRDGVISTDVTDLPNPSDEQACFTANGPVALGDKVVLEEYTFTRTGNDEAGRIGQALAELLTDPVWAEVANRLVILSDGMMSFFARNACEVAQHIRIDDETGTVAGGALYNQENVPSETLFYAILHAFDERARNKPADQKRKAEEALKVFAEKVSRKQVFQFGGDASTGLGYCTVQLGDAKGE